MFSKKEPNSIHKYIRMEKARIRQDIFILEEQEKQIQNLYDKFVKNKPVDTGHPQTGK